jgi:hypothetical protein
MPLVAMEGRSAADVRKSLEEALGRSCDCDNVVVIMQKKEGGLLWFSPGTRTLQETSFLVQSFAFHLMCMAAGIKV